MCNGLLGEWWELSGHQAGVESIGDGLDRVETTKANGAVDAPQNGLCSGASFGPIRRTVLTQDHGRANLPLREVVPVARIPTTGF